MGVKPPGDPGFLSGVFNDVAIYKSPPVYLRRCWREEWPGYALAIGGKSPRENGTKGKLLTSSGNRRNRADCLPQSFQLVVGVAAVDVLAGVARQLHPHFLRHAGIGQGTGEAVPKGMKSAPSKLAPATALNGLKIQSGLAHDTLKALGKPVSTPEPFGAMPGMIYSVGSSLPASDIRWASRCSCSGTCCSTPPFFLTA